MTRTRPSERLRPPRGELREALDAIESSRLERAEALLEKADGPLLWVYYLRGRLSVAREEFDAAADCLLELKKMVADAGRAPDDEALRLAAMALKKLGSIERKREDYLRAIGYHCTEYAYLMHAGSFHDLHDVAVSLDVDHFFAGDAPGSLCWGERSLEFARQISDEQTRYRCEGTSLNNLAMWHADMGDPEDGVELAERSLECWTSYESLAGPDENRVVWAEYGVGYALSKLADSAEGETARNAAVRARSRFDRALALAEERGMSEEDVRPIRDAREELG